MTAKSDENDRLKDVLENEIGRLTKNGQIISPDLKRELGLIKYATKQRNIRADLGINGASRPFAPETGMIHHTSGTSGRG